MFAILTTYSIILTRYKIIINILWKSKWRKYEIKRQLFAVLHHQTTIILSIMSHTPKYLGWTRSLSVLITPLLLPTWRHRQGKDMQVLILYWKWWKLHEKHISVDYFHISFQSDNSVSPGAGCVLLEFAYDIKPLKESKIDCFQLYKIIPLHIKHSYSCDNACKLDFFVIATIRAYSC